PVAITGCDRVLRNAQRFCDFSKGKFVPNFHDQHFALISRQMIERCHQLALRIIQLLKLRLHAPLGLTKNFHFPSRSPVIPPNEIEGGGTNGGIKQGAVFDAEIASPESNKSVLYHVLGISWTPDPLPGVPISQARSFGSRSSPSPRAPLIWDIPLGYGN